MTGVKISTLPAASAANDTDQLEVSQGGTTRRVTVRQLSTLVAKETVSVLDFGGVMNSTNYAANTTALQNAVATGKVVHIPNGTFTINEINFTTNVFIVGEGDASILQWAPGRSVAQLIRCTGTGVKVEFRDLKIDGSQQTIAPTTQYRPTINVSLTASGVSGSRFRAENVWFCNGPDFDVWLIGSLTTGAWVKAEFLGCRFTDGRESHNTPVVKNCTCIGVNDDIDLLVDGCTFDGPIANNIGRVGIRCQQTLNTATQQHGSTVVNACTFRNMGYNNANTLGAIDVYSGQSQVAITGNRIINSFSRGICVKADASGVAIVGNVISGLTGTSAGCITMFAAQSGGTVGKRYVVSGNTCEALVGACIYIDGADFILAPTTPAYDDVIVSNNICRGNTAANAITWRYCRGVKAIGNTVRGGLVGIAATAANTGVHTIQSNDIRDCANSGISFIGLADVNITDNYVFDAVVRGISMGAVNSFNIKGNTVKDCNNGAIVIDAVPTKTSVIQGNTCLDNAFAYTIPNSALIIEMNNVWEPSQGFTPRQVTIAAGVISVVGELHYVETEGATATDDLVTINGGRQNQIIVLYAANSTHDVVLKDGGGNLVLAGDCTLDHANDSITLQKNGTSWCELARSNNA